MKYTQLVFAALSGLSLAEIQWTNLKQAEDMACQPMLGERLAERYPGGKIQCWDKLYQGGYVCEVNEGKAKRQLKMPDVLSLEDLSKREGGLQYCLSGDSKFIPELRCYFNNHPRTPEDPRKFKECAELMAKPADDKPADNRIVFPDN